jgi:hypothetical protein
MSNPDARVDSLSSTSPLPRRSIGYREITTSNTTIPLYAETLKCRTSTLSDPRTRVPQINGSDRVGKSRIAISFCKCFTTPETPISQTPTLRDLSPHVLTDGRLQSYREIMDLDSNMHEFLSLENSDASKLRLVRISCHASLPMDGSNLPSGNRESRFQYARILCPRKPRFSNELKPDDSLAP